MTLKKLINDRLGGDRNLAAERIGISIHHLNNMISNDTKVELLADGRWIILTKYNKFIDVEPI